jgi:hypothetical protein
MKANCTFLNFIAYSQGPLKYKKAVAFRRGKQLFGTKME